MSAGEGETAQGHQWWWITFVNDGDTAATVTQMRAHGQVFVQEHDPDGSRSPKDTCTGSTLGPHRTAPSGMVASCQIGLWGDAGNVAFTLDGYYQSVPIDMAWLTQPEDVTPPRFSEGAIGGSQGGAEGAGLPYGSGPAVRLGDGYLKNLITVEDPSGIDRVELHLVRLNDPAHTDYLAPFDCTGDHTGDCNGTHPFCPQPSSSCTTPTINYGCQVGWPPPRELPAPCQTSRRISYTSITPTAGWLPSFKPYNIPEGQYQMYWKAWDSRGNSQTFQVTSPTIVLDYTPPIVKLSGPLPASAYQDQLKGGDVTIDTDDVTTGVKSIKFFEYAGTSSTRLWEQSWGPRADCTLDRCDQHRYTVSYTVDPISRGWQSGTHDLDVEATDAAENTSPPQPLRVKFWKTSWEHGGSDRRINTTDEINAVRAALGQDGYNNPASSIWNGLVPESSVWNGTTFVAGPPGDQAIIYPISWTLGRGDHHINEESEYHAAFDAVTSAADADAAWAAIAPSDRDTMMAWSMQNALTTYELASPASLTSLQSALNQVGDALSQLQLADANGVGGMERGEGSSVAQFLADVRTAWAVRGHSGDPQVTSVVVRGLMVPTTFSAVGASTYRTVGKVGPAQPPPPYSENGQLFATLPRNLPWAPKAGTLFTEFHSDSQRPAQIISTFTFPTGSLKLFDRKRNLDYAYEHDLKLYYPGGVLNGHHPFCFNEDQHFWARRGAVSDGTNLYFWVDSAVDHDDSIGKAKPYLDSNVGHPCHEMDLTIGFYLPKNLIENRRYTMTLYSMAASVNIANPYQLEASRPARSCPVYSAWCVVSASGNNTNSNLLVGVHSGARIPGCRVWSKDGSSIAC